LAGNARACTRLLLRHELLAEDLCRMLGEDAPADVRGGARRETDDQADRARRIRRLRQRARRDERRKPEQRRRAAVEMGHGRFLAS